MTRTVLASLAAIALAASSASAQPDIAFDRIRTRTDSLYVYTMDGGEREHTGMIHDQLRTFLHDRRPALRRVYRTTDRRLGNAVDTIVSRLPGLAPLAYTSHRRRHGYVEYRAGRILGRMETDSTPVTIDRALREGVYDGASFDLIVRASPLEEGFALSLPAYVLSADVVVTLYAEVARSERIDAGRGRMVEAWVVEMDFGGMKSTLWIDRETHDLVRQALWLRPDFWVEFDHRAPGEFADGN